MRAQRRSRTCVNTVSQASNNFLPRAWLCLEEDEEEEREAAVSADKAECEAECGPEEIQCTNGKWRPCFTVMETRTEEPPSCHLLPCPEGRGCVPWARLCEGVRDCPPEVTRTGGSATPSSRSPARPGAVTRLSSAVRTASAWSLSCSATARTTAETSLMSWTAVRRLRIPAVAHPAARSV